MESEGVIRFVGYAYNKAGDTVIGQIFDPSSSRDLSGELDHLSNLQVVQSPWALNIGDCVVEHDFELIYHNIIYCEEDLTIDAKCSASTLVAFVSLVMNQEHSDPVAARLEAQTRKLVDALQRVVFPSS